MATLERVQRTILERDPCVWCLHGGRSQSFAPRAQLPALAERPLGYTVPCEMRWKGDRSLFTGTDCGDGAA